MKRSLLAALAFVVAFPAVAKDEPPSDWHQVATDTDRDRLRNWRQAWTDALTSARAAGQSKAIAAQGTLFDPDRALAGAKPPPGDYRCRVFKLGAKGPGNRNFVAYPAMRCQIRAEGKVLGFNKVGGSQRPVGQVFDDGTYRQIFLGTLVLGDEQHALDYGRDEARDMAGVIERVGPKRWRMVLPYPNFESLLDVIELVPAR